MGSTRWDGSGLDVPARFKDTMEPTAVWHVRDPVDFPWEGLSLGGPLGIQEKFLFLKYHCGPRDFTRFGSCGLCVKTRTLFTLTYCVFLM